MSVYEIKHRIKVENFETHLVYAHLMSNVWGSNKNYYELYSIKNIFRFVKCDNDSMSSYSLINMNHNDLGMICDYYDETKLENTSKILNNIREYLKERGAPNYDVSI